MERGDLAQGYKGGSTIKLRPEDKAKKSFSFANISKVRESNPEHMQGKKYQKKKGSMAKLNHGGKKKKKGGKGGKR